MLGDKMNYYIFIRPLIGAFTGYVTNWIAVKMMFRPLKPIKIGNFKLPFTPGLIPRNKERLAISIGNTISNDLLSEETLKNSLLSENIKDKISENISIFLNSLSKNDTAISEIISSYVGDDIYKSQLDTIKNKITISIYNTILEAHLGDIVANQIAIAANEKMKNPLLGLFGGKSIVSSISSNIATKIDEYILTNGEILINEMVEKEINKYTSKTIDSVYNDIKKSDININDILMNLYEKIILDKLPILLNTINISQIITDKINSMDVLEVEKLILTIMKKELNALINLGAVIGFLLGLLNLLF